MIILQETKNIKDLSTSMILSCTVNVMNTIILDWSIYVACLLHYLCSCINLIYKFIMGKVELFESAVLKSYKYGVICKEKKKDLEFACFIFKNSFLSA